MKQQFSSVGGVPNARGSMCIAEFTLVDGYGVVVGHEAYCGTRFDRDLPLLPVYWLRGKCCAGCLAAFLDVMRAAGAAGQLTAG